jgi:DNA-binding transcriptional LysR family regulator
MKLRQEGHHEFGTPSTSIERDVIPVVALTKEGQQLLAIAERRLENSAELKELALLAKLTSQAVLRVSV